ncbi:HIT-like protein [Scenedesmus sp. NREL 46B-D3]|nr:HIT-like protein [Scenedesmus sp. NREL 46B-D3]
MATAAADQGCDKEQYDFGPYSINSNEVFAKTQLSFAFVNLKPIVPGHVLISPIRVVRRFGDLTPAEVADLWGLAQLVGKTLEPHYEAQSLTLAIQDGPAAGQTVPHVHVHVLPRKPGDFEHNDEVYDEIDKSEAHLTKLSERLDLDKERVVRTRQEMAAETAELRRLFTTS